MDQIMKDTRDIIFPGMTHWQHPNFFSYFASDSNSAAVVSELFSKTFSNPGFDWKSAPATTELETVISDWCVKACGFDAKFLFANGGGGTIVNTISEGVFINVHSAKKRKMEELGMKPTDPQTLKFVGYFTEFAHSCFHSAFRHNFVYEERMIPADYNTETK